MTSGVFDDPQEISMATPMTTDQLLAVLMAEGLTVMEVPGWRDRCRCHTGSHEKNVGWLGNTSTRGWGDVNGTLTHITAGTLGKRTVLEYIRDIINGDPDVPCKAQFVVDPVGVVWINSAGRSNHAGKVGTKVRDHLRAADFSLTDDFDNRFTGAGADGNAFTYGIENIAVGKITAAQRAASVKINAAIARHYKWSGQESVGHGEVSSARGKADPNLHMGDFRKDVIAAVKATKPKPPVPPKPAKTATKTSATQNMAGNNAYGIKTGRTRAKAYAKARIATPVDALSVQETTVASLVRPTLDAGLKGHMARVGGGKGRYSYLGTRPKLVAAGLITVSSKHWYKKDDKQASWVIDDIEGIRSMDVNVHLESDSGSVADGLRVDQMLDILFKALAIAAKHGVPIANITFTGDTNSEALVAEVLEQHGWVNAAAGTKFLNTPTFIGWDGKAKKRFDYFFVHQTCPKATVVAVTADTDIADHAGLRLVRTITR